ncbi:hypothetical protein A3K82_03115 [Candidatus Pacearchaeota archaeon RBG_19FT_COMBO_34_9]|nr:MAG: hypothetical protein A3K82_03115 [Candidatus Pacearchaeota archaeon RBG_19FT_COMBO_34_9]OGJ17045.1 MAG: hypothetical protein A3K74_01495 [Candidatus Pacearchaeota archaeon RBG_13_33_26]
MTEIERKILWYMYSENNPERHFWNVLIINEGEKIKTAKQKLYEELSPLVEGTLVSFNPIVNEYLIDKGKIENSKLYYELLCLEATVSAVNFSNVYQGKVKWDRRLQPRKSKDGWDDFIDKIYRGEI